jgi:hypothetical protein
METHWTYLLEFGLTYKTYGNSLEKNKLEN